MGNSLSLIILPDDFTQNIHNDPTNLKKCAHSHIFFVTSEMFMYRSLDVGLWIYKIFYSWDVIQAVARMTLYD